MVECAITFWACRNIEFTINNDLIISRLVKALNCRSTFLKNQFREFLNDFLIHPSRKSPTDLPLSTKSDRNNGLDYSLIDVFSLSYHTGPDGFARFRNKSSRVA